LALDQFATMPRGGGVYMLHATADGVPACIPRTRNRRRWRTADW